MEDQNMNSDEENKSSGDKEFVEKREDASKNMETAVTDSPSEIIDTSSAEIAVAAEVTPVTSEQTDTPAGLSQPNLQPTSDATVPTVERPPREPINIKIIYNKKKYDHFIDINCTILELKCDIEKLTGVPVATQKVMYKGSTQDTQTLKQLKVSKSANKFMVIGSTMDDLLKVATPDIKAANSSGAGTATATSKEPLCKQTVHKKVLDKHGKPEDVAVGIKGAALPLPNTPLSGMYNKYGGKTRLTFKLDSDELWIGTKERTQKIKMPSIKDIVSQPIEGHEDYHIMGIQLGSTEASKYWIYWVPAQYINAIKDTALGKWGEF
ncbi:ubiquitin domain-containing protein UBFD1-like [Watersipora subatra]|uniref:ubiquitin domain-containing protein UBFD1-like n=1 Tax=Watersipora subatra TaxID=2589382 RepID=UPI00355BA800